MAKVKVVKEENRTQEVETILGRGSFSSEELQAARLEQYG